MGTCETIAGFSKLREVAPLFSLSNPFRGSVLGWTVIVCWTLSKLG